MKLIETPPGALKGLRRRAETSFQRTFATPLKRLPEFVGALIPADPPIRTATAIVESVVFEPKHLVSLLVAHGLPTPYGAQSSIAAASFEESATLLEALLGDWLDFYFAPEPKHILLYADHDEYTTVFATRKGPLSQIAKRMSVLGIAEIADYTRRPRRS